MASQSPSSLYVYENNCPKALEYYIESRATRDEVEELHAEIGEAAFEGIIFHACMHSAGLAIKDGKDGHSAIQVTADSMLNKYPAECCYRARNMAELYLEENLFDFQNAKEIYFEHGIAYDRYFRRCKWDSENLIYRMVLDRCGLREDVDEQGLPVTVAFGLDYKTGWGANVDELDSIQMKSYVLALHEMYGDKADAIEICVDGVRFGSRWTKRYYLVDEMDKIEADIQYVKYMIASADNSSYPAIPGPRCANCDNKKRCDAFNAEINKEFAKLIDVPDVELMRHYMALKQRVSEVEEILKQRCRQHPIVADNHVLGFHPHPRGILSDAHDLFDLYCKALGAEPKEKAKQFVYEFLDSLGLSKTHFDNLVGAYAKGLGFRTKRAAKEELGSEMLDQTIQMRFECKHKRKSKIELEEENGSGVTTEAD